MTFDLRPYQISGINSAREAMRDHKRIIIYSPTGSGKTEIAMHIIQSARAKGTRVAFICPRINLVNQASKRFSLAGIDHGIIQADNTHDVHKDVLICSIHTIARRGYPEVGLMVIDEAHGCASQAYQDLLQAYNNVPTVGLTATPFTRGLGRKHEWGTLFEKIVIATTIPQAIRDGYLVDCEIYAPSTPDLSGVKIVRGDYHEAQLGAAVDKPSLVGDIVTHWKRLSKGLPTVVFATNIAHSKHIAEEFIANGIAAEHMDCNTSDEEREAILDRYNSGMTRIVTNVGILSEGWDAPHTGCMVLARPTRSLTRYIQMVGRALRPHDGKRVAIVLDHSGTVHRLGYPTDDLPLELNDGKKPTASDPVPKEKLPHECHNCHFMIPAGKGVCPQCGAVPQRKDKTKTADGELKKIERLSREQKQEIWSASLGLAQERKRSNGWAAHLYKSIVGVFPYGLSDIPTQPTQRVVNMAKHNAIRYAKGREKHAHA